MTTTADRFQVGSKVRLNVPQNERLHGQPATVTELTEWGAHVACEAAATGQFRALFSEMELLEPVRHQGPVRPASRVASRDAGYTGDTCDQCGSATMKRNGSCLLCCTCGSTSGCS